MNREYYEHLAEMVDIPAVFPKPINDWLLTANIQPKEIKRASGVILPQYETKEDLAVVLAVGPGPRRFGTEQDCRSALSFKPGDVIRTTRRKGRTMHLDVHGAAGAQKDFAWYQENEVIAIECHSEEIALRVDYVQGLNKHYIESSKSPGEIAEEMALTKS